MQKAESSSPCLSVFGVCLDQCPPAAQVLIVFAALSTCDPGNVLDAVKAAKQHHVRVSVVGIAAEVHICRVLTQARWPTCASAGMLCMHDIPCRLCGRPQAALDINQTASLRASVAVFLSEAGFRKVQFSNLKP